MCIQCVGAVGTALQAATLIGGPIAYRHYRRVRAALGLPDTSVAAVEARAAGAAQEEIGGALPSTTDGPARRPARLSSSERAAAAQA